MVTFMPDAIPSLLQFVQMADELELLLKRPVDLITRRSVETSPNYLLRREVLYTAEVLYAT
jgi:hypothetical protein